MAKQLASLIVDISNGTRESPIEGTPQAYTKIYTDCWQHDPNNRPDIQKVFLDLENLTINDINRREQYNTHKLTHEINLEQNIFTFDSNLVNLMPNTSSFSSPLN
ncbi:3173_t:CDS:2, partial [Scutellospora calospora]